MCDNIILNFIPSSRECLPFNGNHNYPIALFIDSNNQHFNICRTPASMMDKNNNDVYNNDVYNNDVYNTYISDNKCENNDKMLSSFTANVSRETDTYKTLYICERDNNNNNNNNSFIVQENIGESCVNAQYPAMYYMNRNSFYPTTTMNGLTICKKN